MSTLPELIGIQNELTEKLIELEGELSEADEKELELLHKALPEKVQKYHNLLSLLDNQASFMKERKDFYAKAESAAKNLQKNIKHRIKTLMIDNDITELQGQDMIFKRCKAKPALILDEQQLLDCYKKTTIYVEPDKEKIRTAIENDTEVNGARLENNYAVRTYPKGK